MEQNQTNQPTLDPSKKGLGVFVNLCSNAGVKHALADPTNEKSLPALKALLNYYLPENRKIREITGFINVEAPGFTLINRDIVIDIRCVDNQGRQFIVEVQSYSQDTFFVRTVAYMASVYRQGLKKGKDGYTKLQPVFLLALMNFRPSEDEFKNDHRLVSRCEFQDIDPNYLVPTTLSAIFVRLTELPKNYEDCLNDESRCAWIIKNGHMLKEIPKDESDQGIKDILKAAEIAAYDQIKKQEYEEDVMFENDYYAILAHAKKEGREEGLATGREEGREEGMAVGREEGREEGALSIAQKFKKMGIPIEQIAQGTGLTTEQVAAL